MLADEFAQTIAERRSVGPKQQTHNAPSDDVFVRAARAARSAPSHNPFFPCRFVKVVSREKLADVFESALPQGCRLHRHHRSETHARYACHYGHGKFDDRGRRFDQLP